MECSNGQTAGSGTQSERRRIELTSLHLHQTDGRRTHRIIKGVSAHIGFGPRLNSAREESGHGLIDPQSSNVLSN
jgi:hypothetical protein